VTAARDRLVRLWASVRNLRNSRLIPGDQIDGACMSPDANSTRTAVVVASISVMVSPGRLSFSRVAPAGKLRLSVTGHPSGSRMPAIMTGGLFVSLAVVVLAPWEVDDLTIDADLPPGRISISINCRNPTRTLLQWAATRTGSFWSGHWRAICARRPHRRRSTQQRLREPRCELDTDSGRRGVDFCHGVVGALVIFLRRPCRQIAIGHDRAPVRMGASAVMTGGLFVSLAVLGGVPCEAGNRSIDAGLPPRWLPIPIGCWNLPGGFCE
jgi:hypothetical protein